MNSATWKQFRELVEIHFAYLQDEFGFACESTGPPSVVYVSQGLRVFVHYDMGYSSELDVGIVKRDAPPDTLLCISMGMLICLKHPNNTMVFDPPHPTRDSTLKIEVARLASLLREHGATLLAGDLHVFAKAEQLEKELRKKLGKK
jgi:hypothetical protein